jgi:hypothetical protein
MKKVYIASKYSNGDVGQNINEHFRLADYITSLGGVHVKTPLSSHLWHLISPRPYEFWLKYDLVELDECDALVRMTGASEGADREVAHAAVKGLPIHLFNGFDFESLNKLDKFINSLKTNNGK